MSAKEERTDRESRRPRVVCLACDYAWHSAAMAEGLRSLAGCPRCGGELRFGETVASVVPDVEPAGALPHLVLGIPRPRPR